MGRFAIGVRCCPFRALLVLLFLVAWAEIATAQSPPTIVRVEEDWELVVGEPDPGSDAPQVTSVISPLGGVQSVHATFEVNQQSLPTFTPGGLQLQVWDNEVSLSDRGFPNSTVFAQSGETIRWTQSMELNDGSLSFEIINGTSTTWGNFGGQGYLKASIPTTLISLDAYDPAVSAENSGVNYAANRVQSLVLKRVRVYTSTGEQLEDTTARVVHPRN